MEKLSVRLYTGVVFVIDIVRSVEIVFVIEHPHFEVKLSRAVVEFPQYIICFFFFFNFISVQRDPTVLLEHHQQQLCRQKDVRFLCRMGK